MEMSYPDGAVNFQPSHKDSPSHPCESTTALGDTHEGATVESPVRGGSYFSADGRGIFMTAIESPPSYMQRSGRAVPPFSADTRLFASERNTHKTASEKQPRNNQTTSASVDLLGRRAWDDIMFSSNSQPQQHREHKRLPSPSALPNLSLNQSQLSPSQNKARGNPLTTTTTTASSSSGHFSEVHSPVNRNAATTSNATVLERSLSPTRLSLKAAECGAPSGLLFGPSKGPLRSPTHQKQQSVATAVPLVYSSKSQGNSTTTTLQAVDPSHGEDVHRSSHSRSSRLEGAAAIGRPQNGATAEELSTNQQTRTIDPRRDTLPPAASLTEITGSARRRTAARGKRASPPLQTPQVTSAASDTRQSSPSIGVSTRRRSRAVSTVTTTATTTATATTSTTATTTGFCVRLDAIEDDRGHTANDERDEDRIALPRVKRARASDDSQRDFPSDYDNHTAAATGRSTRSTALEGGVTLSATRTSRQRRTPRHIVTQGSDVAALDHTSAYPSLEAFSEWPNRSPGEVVDGSDPNRISAVESRHQRGGNRNLRSEKSSLLGCGRRSGRAHSSKSKDQEGAGVARDSRTQDSHQPVESSTSLTDSDKYKSKNRGGSESLPEGDFGAWGPDLSGGSGSSQLAALVKSSVFSPFNYLKSHFIGRMFGPDSKENTTQKSENLSGAAGGLDQNSSQPPVSAMRPKGVPVNPTYDSVTNKIIPPNFVTLPDLVSKDVGGQIIFATDQFFAPAENLLSPTPPVFIADKFTKFGKWMDGWESQRRRQPKHDWCIIELGAPGVVYGVEVSTRHFTGNQAPAFSLEAANVPNLREDIERIMAKTKVGSYNQPIGCRTGGRQHRTPTQTSTGDTSYNGVTTLTTRMNPLSEGDSSGRGKVEGGIAAYPEHIEAVNDFLEDQSKADDLQWRDLVGVSKLRPGFDDEMATHYFQLMPIPNPNTGRISDGNAPTNDVQNRSGIATASKSTDNDHHIKSVGLCQYEDLVTTHIRLNMFPDGGIARVRVYGVGVKQLSAEEKAGAKDVDLTAATNGALIAFCTDKHFGDPKNLLLRSFPRNMGSGWETARKPMRAPYIEVDKQTGEIMNLIGEDSAVIKLSRRAKVTSLEIDTTHFMGNFPESCTVMGIDISQSRNPALLAILNGKTPPEDTLAKCGSLDWRDLETRVFRHLLAMTSSKVSDDTDQQDSSTTEELQSSDIQSCEEVDADNELKKKVQSAALRSKGPLWIPILPRTKLQPHHNHVFTQSPMTPSSSHSRQAAESYDKATGQGKAGGSDVTSSVRSCLSPISNADAITHLKLTIIPDGGIARLRAYGVVAFENEA